MWSAARSPTETERFSEPEAKLRAALPDVFEKDPAHVADDEYIRPDKTVFERLEDYWDAAQSFLNPVQKQLDVLRGLHDGSILGVGLEWGFVFMLWGFFIRLLSLGPMLYAHRNQLRTARIQPQLNEIAGQIKRTKADKTLSSQEKRVMKEGYKRMEKALYKKHGCSQKRALVSAITSPLMISAFVAIRRLAMYEDSLESASFLWVKDLTMPDPTYILPVLCTLLFVVNFEMNQSTTRGGRSATLLYVRWAMRGGSFIFVYFFSAQPTALFAYWIGMSGAGTVQPMLLRWKWFRTYFNFPDPHKVASQHRTVFDRLSSLLRGGSFFGAPASDAAAGSAASPAGVAAGAAAGAAPVYGASGQALRNVRDEDVVFVDGDGEGQGQPVMSSRTTPRL